MLRNSVALLALLPLLGSCLIKPLGMKGYVGYMNLTPSGDFGLNDSSGSSNLGDIKIDIEDDFDIGDASTPYVRFETGLGNWDLTLSAFHYDESGNQPSSSAPFGDLPAGSNLDSDLEILNVKTALTYGLPLVGWVGLDVGIGICIDYFDIAMDVESLDSGGNVIGFERIDFEAPVPMLFAKAGFAFPGVPISASLDVGWINIDLSDGKGTVLDVEAMVSWTLIPTLEIFLGYRHVTIDVLGDIDGQQFDTDLRLDGWLFGGGFSF